MKKKELKQKLRYERYFSIYWEREAHRLDSEISRLRGIIEHWRIGKDIKYPNPKNVKEAPDHLSIQYRVGWNDAISTFKKLNNTTL